MANMSNYLEQQLARHLFRSASFPKPSQLAIALCTVVPAESDTTLAGKEVANANGYTRMAANPSDTAWSEAQNADGDWYVTNTADIVFPQATGPWGTVTAIAICDSATYGAGQMLFWATLPEPKSVGTGDSFILPAGSVVVTFK